jgi:L-2,4-diaminobutyric acid acetyltransferase
MASSKKTAFNITNTKKEDGLAVHDIVKKCSSLDLNSRYCYLLLCSHFGKYCLIAKNGKETVGFVSAYPHPHYSDTLFIWQIAVDPRFQNQGIGTALLEQLVLLSAENGLKYIETTITPSNKASYALFKKISEEYNADCRESVYFPRNLFEGDHDEERLLRIGPIK